MEIENHDRAAGRHSADRLETEHLKDWLTEPDRRAMLNIRGIEKTCDLPNDTLRSWLRGSQGLAQHHLDNLVRMLSLVGYEAVSSQQ